MQTHKTICYVSDNNGGECRRVIQKEQTGKKKNVKRRQTRKYHTMCLCDGTARATLQKKTATETNIQHDLL